MEDNDSETFANNQSLPNVYCTVPLTKITCGEGEEWEGGLFKKKYYHKMYYTDFIN